MFFINVLKLKTLTNIFLNLFINFTQLICLILFKNDEFLRSIFKVFENVFPLNYLFKILHRERSIMMTRWKIIKH